MTSMITESYVIDLPRDVDVTTVALPLGDGTTVRADVP
jgi:hypothetical protein